MADIEAQYWRGRQKDETRRSIRKQIKGKEKARGGARTDWRPGDPDDDAAPTTERVMPPGERERRRNNAALARSLQEMEAGGEAGGTAGAPDERGRHAVPDGERAGERGVVVEVSQGLCRVQAAGEVVLCTVRGSLSASSTGFTNVVAVGDDVVVARDGSGGGIVLQVLPRRSALVRPDVYHPHLQQVIVANAGQLLAVAAWRDPAIWLELVDRYLITAARFGLDPLICVNKTDLAADPGACQAALAPYQAVGYRVLFTSAATGEGLGELHEALRGRTTVLAGLSGVGKSSLLAAIQPDLHLRTGAVASYHIGRHTTTQVRMFPLQGGGYVVDTPGIREFGLSGLARRDLATFYPEIADVAGDCRFRDCLHVEEEGCAVEAALDEGGVSATRYKNYKKILRTLPG